MKSRRSAAFERGTEGAPLRAPTNEQLPPRLRPVREVIRDEHSMKAPILKALGDGPLTIPQIAEAVGKPSHEVVFWVMGLRKYGWIAEIKEVDDDGYFTYQAIPREES